MNNNAVALRPTASRQDVPLFTELGKKACEAILSRNNVGRIAFTLHDIDKLRILGPTTAEVVSD